MTGPYYVDGVEAWKAADGSPMERAKVKGPGLDGTLFGPTARAEATSRANQLNVAYQAGARSGAATAVDLDAAYKRGFKAGKRAKAGAGRKRR